LSLKRQVPGNGNRVTKGRTQDQGNQNQGGLQMLDLADKVRLTVEQAARIMDEYKHRLSEVRRRSKS